MGKIPSGWSRKNIGASVRVIFDNRDIPKLEVAIPWEWFGGNLCLPAWNNGCCAMQKIPRKAKNGKREGAVSKFLMGAWVGICCWKKTFGIQGEDWIGS